LSTLSDAPRMFPRSSCVAVQADPGEPCDLFAAEARHAPLLAEVGQAGLPFSLDDVPAAWAAQAAYSHAK
jgi:hypothetical protein